MNIKSIKHYRKKLISCSSSKLKTSAHQKPPLRKRKTKPQTRTKYTQYIHDNGLLLYKLCKELLQINHNRTNANKIIGKRFEKLLHKRR